MSSLLGWVPLLLLLSACDRPPGAGASVALRPPPVRIGGCLHVTLGAGPQGDELTCIVEADSRPSLHIEAGAGRSVRLGSDAPRPADSGLVIPLPDGPGDQLIETIGEGEVARLRVRRQQGRSLDPLARIIDSVWSGGDLQEAERRLAALRGALLPGDEARAKSLLARIGLRKARPDRQAILALLDAAVEEHCRLGQISNATEDTDVYLYVSGEADVPLATARGWLSLRRCRAGRLLLDTSVREDYYLGIVAFGRGETGPDRDTAAAKDLFQRAAAEAERLGLSEMRELSTLMLGRVLALRGQYDEAVALYERSISAHPDGQDRCRRTFYRGALAEILGRMLEAGLGGRHHERARALREELSGAGERYQACQEGAREQFQGQLGWVRLLLSLPLQEITTEHAARMAAILKEARAGGTPGIRWEAEELTARLSEATGRPAEARALYERLIRRAQAQERGATELRLLVFLSRLHLRQGRRGAARATYERAAALLLREALEMPVCAPAPALGGPERSGAGAEVDSGLLPCQWRAADDSFRLQAMEEYLDLLLSSPGGEGRAAALDLIRQLGRRAELAFRLLRSSPRSRAELGEVDGEITATLRQLAGLRHLDQENQVGPAADAKQRSEDGLRRDLRALQERRFALLEPGADLQRAGALAPRTDGEAILACHVRARAVTCVLGDPAGTYPSVDIALPPEDLACLRPRDAAWSARCTLSRQAAIVRGPAFADRLAALLQRVPRDGLLRVTTLGLLRHIDLAALQLPEDHAPLIERMAVSYSLDLPPGAERAAAAAEGSLLVLNASHHLMNEQKDPLRQQLARLLGPPIQLLGPDHDSPSARYETATQEALLGGLGRARVFVYVGHVDGDAEGSGATMSLRTTGGPTTAQDLDGLPRAPDWSLIIACGGAAATGSASLMGIDLSQSLILRGGRAVLSTSQPIDEAFGQRATALLLADLPAARGAELSEAALARHLRGVQRELRAAGDAERVPWGTFRVIHR